MLGDVPLEIKPRLFRFDPCRLCGAIKLIEPLRQFRLSVLMKLSNGIGIPASGGHANFQKPRLLYARNFEAPRHHVMVQRRHAHHGRGPCATLEAMMNEECLCGATLTQAPGRCCRCGHTMCDECQKKSNAAPPNLRGLGPECNPALLGDRTGEPELDPFGDTRGRGML